MSAAAYANDDQLVMLGQHLRIVERHHGHATKFQMVAEGLRAMRLAVERWDTLPDALRDLLRHVANLMMPARSSVLTKARAGWEFGLLALKLGPDEAMRQVMDFAAARQEFLDAVLDAEERSNTALQEHLASCISNGLADQTRTVVPREQVSEWFRRLQG